MCNHSFSIFINSEQKKVNTNSKRKLYTKFFLISIDTLKQWF